MSENNSGAIDPTTGTAGNAKTGEPLEHAPPNAHSRLDRKDERSHGDTIKAAEQVEKKEKEAEIEAAHVDPTAAARAHGNEPSRGAKKDKELIEDDEEILRKMDEAKAQSAEHHKQHGKH